MPTALLFALLLLAAASGSSAAQQRQHLPYYPAAAAAAPAASLVIDVQRSWGAITFQTLRAAYAAGVQALGEHDSVAVRLGPGVHVVNMTGDLFEVDAVRAPGELAVEGAGKNETVLLLDQGMNNIIKGRSFRNIAFRDLTFSHTTGQTTKGRVVAVDNRTLTVDVPDGFPSPQHILENRWPRLRPDQGLYMLQYTTAPPGSALTPAKRTVFLDVVNQTCLGALPAFNAHLAYRCSLSDTPAVNKSVSGYVCDAVKHMGGGKWQFTLGQAAAWASLRPLYEQAIGNPAIEIGIKAKRGGQAYALSNG
eukprot:COSAG01_NODE_17242_length_1167_cov_1.304307_1_plen_306_part_10